MTTFDEWWKHFPRKDGKADARKAWSQVSKLGHLSDDVIAGTKAYAMLWKERGTDRSFIPMPATFLRGKRWQDECITGMFETAPTLLSSEPLPSTWNGPARKLMDVIGEPSFRAWFAGTDFVDGTPPKIIAPTTARRDYILNRFDFKLERLWPGISVLSR